MGSYLCNLVRLVCLINLINPDLRGLPRDELVSHKGQSVSWHTTMTTELTLYHTTLSANTWH